ncbi:iron-sulfur cluster assembly protein [Amycolatopsis sp. NBC_01480]|uniref:iron-sulfur cluster assembly protein n=1 Tax=Amycolatopsis sp. NBC_01480 TaxID=2903562 RepID=UPI002E29A6BD|nr:iron-sulfur cluster assembly protein [Amycolatopsis sp. NBC_01480]
MTAATSETLTARVWRALATVVDPELDEPITGLGFVSDVQVRLHDDGGHAVAVRLRLPTYLPKRPEASRSGAATSPENCFLPAGSVSTSTVCAPNFAYLMVADAHDAVLALPSVGTVEVVLEDHFAAESGFGGAFPGQGGGEPAELRLTFRRKAHLACLERAVRRLVGEGWQIDALSAGRLGDVPESPERESLLRRRAELGLSTDPGSPLLVEDDGEAVAPERVAGRLRFAKAVRVSIEGNSGLCRGLLHTRYPETRTAREEVSS